MPASRSATQSSFTTADKNYNDKGHLLQGALYYLCSISRARYTTTLISILITWINRHCLKNFQKNVPPDYQSSRAFSWLAISIKSSNEVPLKQSNKLSHSLQRHSILLPIKLKCNPSYRHSIFSYDVFSSKYFTTTPH